MKKSSHGFHKIIFAIYLVTIAWTSFTHASEYRAPERAAATGAARAAMVAPVTPRGRWAVSAYVQRAAAESGVNPHVAEWIVSHESTHRPEATGDGGESRGLWQINKEWHPEVSDSCAYDVRCSTGWSLGRIRAGYAKEWSTWKYCREKFEDCPF